MQLSRRFSFLLHFGLIFSSLLIFSCGGGGVEDNGGSSGGGGPVDPPKEIIPSNLSLNVTIIGQDSDNPNGDGSGKVRFSASATNAVSYSYRFGTGDLQSSTSSVEYTYTDTGTKTYNVTVLAYSSTNHSVSVSKSITVYVKAISDITLLELLAGSSEKTWKINAAQDAHFSLGSSDHQYPNNWNASSFSKSESGFYDDEFVFNIDGTYTHTTNNTVFGKASFLNSDFGEKSGYNANSDGEIENYPLDNYQTTFSAKSENGTDKLEFGDNGFLGFYVGEQDFTITCFDETNILFRTVDTTGTAWYFWLTSETISETPSADQFTNLVWSDEFNNDGSLDSSKWVHETGTGEWGWGNDEKQFYTNRSENSKVEDGLLKITARKESWESSNYTSARIKTNKKFDFKYGRIDVRAKMPSKTNGVWPAIWMLGSNFSSDGWPECGEIDIQEYAHTNNFRVQSTVHHPDVSPGEGDTHIASGYNDVNDKFYTYSLVWTKEALTFYVDNKPHKIVGNSCALPFNSEFFIILNFAMGGTMGGDIDPNFSSDSMEIDYVRVYQ